jgi:signal transduction histidine kinase
MADTLKRHLGAQIELSIIVDQVSGWIEADPLQLEQAILNVATNSREAMPNGGNFSIVVSRVNSEGDRCLPSHVRGGRYVMVSLRDDGPGMDRKTLSRLFEVFFSTKDSKTNTGIGLAMVRSLLKQRGGDVEVSSELGKGTTVNLILPELACLDDVPNHAQKSFH